MKSFEFFFVFFFFYTLTTTKQSVSFTLFIFIFLFLRRGVGIRKAWLEAFVFTSWPRFHGKNKMPCPILFLYFFCSLYRGHNEPTPTNTPSIGCNIHWLGNLCDYLNLGLLNP
jgi:hypothetical protein